MLETIANRRSRCGFRQLIHVHGDTHPFAGFYETVHVSDRRFVLAYEYYNQPRMNAVGTQIVALVEKLGAQLVGQRAAIQNECGHARAFVR